MNTGEQGTIILKADDYGNFDPANRAILDAVFLGTLNCVGVMTTFAEPEDAKMLQMAVANAPDPSLCSIGLHYNQNTGRPLTDVPGLIEDGNFRRVDSTQEAWEAYAKTLVGHEDEIKQEMEAQILRFRELFGHVPDFIDAHNVSTSVEPMASIAIKLAKKYGIRAISIPRVYAPQADQDGIFGISVVNEPLRREYREQDIETADRATLVYVNAADNPEAELLSILQHPPTGSRTEVTFHPSYPYPPHNGITTLEPPEREVRRVIDANLLTLPSVIHAAAELRRQGRTRGYGV